MDLQKLQYFVSVAELRNFTAAAAKHYISQPSLSRHINDLEYDLGVRLFIRSKHTVTLTPEGETLLPMAREIIDRSDQFMNLSSSLAKSGSGYFSIGYSGYWEFHYLCELVEKFSAQYPHVRFNFIREHHGRLSRRLQQGDCDIALMLKESDFLNLGDQIGWKLIATTPFVIVLSSRHPLAKREFLHLSDIAYETIIPLAHNQDSILNTMIAQEIQKYNPSPNYFPFPPQNSYDLSLQVLANKGITITSSWLELSDISGLSFCKIEDDMPSAEFGIAYRKEKRSALLHAFLSIADETPFIDHTGRKGEGM